MNFRIPLHRRAFFLPDHKACGGGDGGEEQIDNPQRRVAPAHFYKLSAQRRAEKRADLVPDQREPVQHRQLLCAEFAADRSHGRRHGGIAAHAQQSRHDERKGNGFRQQQKAGGDRHADRISRAEDIFHLEFGTQPAGQYRAQHRRDAVDGQRQRGDAAGDSGGGELGEQMTFDNRHIKTAGGKANQSAEIIPIPKRRGQDTAQGVLFACGRVRRRSVRHLPPVQSADPNRDRDHDQERDAQTDHGGRDSRKGNKPLHARRQQRVADPRACLQNAGDQNGTLFADQRRNGAHQYTGRQSGGTHGQHNAEGEQQHDEIFTERRGDQSQRDQKDAQQHDEGVALFQRQHPHKRLRDAVQQRAHADHKADRRVIQPRTRDKPVEHNAVIIVYALHKPKYNAHGAYNNDGLQTLASVSFGHTYSRPVNLNLSAL